MDSQALGILRFGWIPGEFNLSDLFTKTTMPGNKRHSFFIKSSLTQHHQLVILRRRRFICTWVHLSTSYTTRLVTDSGFWDCIYIFQIDHQGLSICGDYINMLVNIKSTIQTYKQRLEERTGKWERTEYTDDKEQTEYTNEKAKNGKAKIQELYVRMTKHNFGTFWKFLAVIII